jgi:hypothetical protein
MINPSNPFRSTKAIKIRHTHSMTKNKDHKEKKLNIDSSKFSHSTEKKEFDFTAQLSTIKEPVITKSFYQALNREQIEERQSKILDIGEKLPMVIELRQELQTNGSAVVFGPSGSGKTEQIEIALGKQQTLFDLRNDFLEDYFEKNNIPKENRKEVRKQYYSTEMKENERKFLELNKQQIINRLLEDKNQTIVIDEFDLASNPLLSEDELASCLMTLEIASELRKSGKKVVMILHNSGMQSPQVQECLKKNELLKPNSNVIQTRYLDINSQKKILNSINLSEYQIDRIIQISSGCPATYLGFLKECGKNAMGETSRTREDPKFEDLVKESYTRVSSSWYWAKQLESKETLELLTQLALKEISIDDEKVLKNKDSLLITGMLGEVNGKLVLPKVCEDIINDDIWSSKLEKRFAGKYIEIHNENDIQKYLSAAPEAVQEAARNTLHSSSSSYIIDDFEGIPVIISKTPSVLNELMQYNKKIISDKLELKNLPMENVNMDHLTWANTALTPNELVVDAEKVAGFFFKIVKDSCFQIDEKIHAVYNYQSLVKS